MKTFKVLAILVAGGAAAVFAYIYLGVFDVAADRPHWQATVKLIDAVRERSIAMRDHDIEVPDLENPALVGVGGPDYNEMCSVCHLKPGVTQTEISVGLYPQPPNLSQAESLHGHTHEHDPADRARRQFWIIKHGLKMTGMASWGSTHDDDRIWAMVAFLQKLPELSAEQYREVTTRAEGDPGHHHAHGDQAGAEQARGSEGGHGHLHGKAAAEAVAPAGSALSALETFQKALRTADQNVARQMLAPDVLIYESGRVQRSREEYASHHMKDDMAFLSTAQAELLKRDVQDAGSKAVVSSETRIRGKGKKGPVDVVTTETAVLMKTGDRWRITHLHWSSRPFEPVAAHQH